MTTPAAARPSPPATKRTGAAERMREHRAHRAVGHVLVNFWLSRDGIGLLASLGWLTDADRQDPAAVRRAFEGFVNKAARAGVKPGG